MASSVPIARALPAERPAGFRLGLISLLAALVGILAGIVAYVLYDLIGLFTNLAYYHEWSFHFRSPEHSPLGLWIIVMPVIGGIDRRLHGEIRVAEDQRARNSGSDGSGADVAQPDRSESRDSEAAFGGDCDWNRRAIRRGRADYSDGRGDRVAGGANYFDNGGGKKSAAGVRRGRGHGGDVQHADCRR